MRFLKRLLISIYVFVGVFSAACFVAWCFTGSEPAALIAGVCGAAGVESVIGGMMKIREIKAERERDERLIEVNKSYDDSPNGEESDYK